MTILEVILGASIVIGAGIAIWTAGANSQRDADHDVIASLRAENARLQALDPAVRSKAHHPSRLAAVPHMANVVDIADRRQGPEPAA